MTYQSLNPPNWLMCYQEPEVLNNEVKVFLLPLGRLAVTYLSIDVEQQKLTSRKLQAIETVIDGALDIMSDTLAAVSSRTDEGQISASIPMLSVLIVDIESDNGQWLDYWYAKRIQKNNSVPQLNSQAASIPTFCLFSPKGWEQIITVLPTPGELWRYLLYHHRILSQSLAAKESFYVQAKSSLMTYVNSLALFSPAIEVDNTLLKYGLKDAPNASLVTMAAIAKESKQSRVSDELNIHTLKIEEMSQALKANSDNRSIMTPLFDRDSLTIDQRHLLNAAALWSQLCLQMVPITDATEASINEDWLRQLLDESLFSRYQLVSELYNFANQPVEKRQSGYVVHQHSYESLGRHYVMIFYGQSQAGSHQKHLLQPKLADIASDMVSRLPISELHHIIVLGISFVRSQQETFIELDAYIKAVTPMSARERQLTRQLQKAASLKG